MYFIYLFIDKKTPFTKNVVPINITVAGITILIKNMCALYKNNFLYFKRKK